MTKIVVTKVEMFSGKPVRTGRVYLDKEKITEVFEGNGYCTIYVNSRTIEYLQVAETFEEVKALIDYEPEVADIFIKGKELS